ncbi:MAG: aminotransferase class III-fold pyridoxal phosphate-dependent enzyme [Thermomicrobiales bacterium]
MDHAEGIYVWDRDGQRYMDFTSGIAVVNAGHCHPRVVEAIRAQAGKIIHAQQNILLHEPMLDAAAELTATLPSSLNQVFWANSGAEAIEGALKLAKIATRRPAVIPCAGHFMAARMPPCRSHPHAPRCAATMNRCSPACITRPTPTTTDRRSAPAPGEADDYYLSELKTLFDTMVMPDDVAAILVETIAGEGGYLALAAMAARGARDL